MPRGASRYDEALLQGRLWTPQQLIGNGLRCWFDFTEQGDGTVSATGLTNHRDRAGGPSLSAGSASSVRPTFSPSQARSAPLVRFQTTSRLFSSPATASFTAPFVAVAAFQPESTTAENGRIFSFSASGVSDFNSNSSLIFMLRLSNSNNIQTFQNFSSRASTAYTFNNTPTIFSVTSTSAGAIQHWLNGAPGATGTLGSTAFGAGSFLFSCVTVDGQAAADQFIGLYGGAAVYSGPDADVQRPRLEAYFAWRIGWQERLTASHPYRNTPPLIGG